MRFDVKAHLEPQDIKHFEDLDWLDCCLKCKGINRPSDNCFKGRRNHLCPDWQRESEATFGRLKGKSLHDSSNPQNISGNDLKLYNDDTLKMHQGRRTNCKWQRGNAK